MAGRKVVRLTLWLLLPAAALATAALFYRENAISDGYTIPADICGIQVPPAAKDPLFPPGGELAVRQSGGEGDPTRMLWCSYTVDDELALIVTVDGFRTRTGLLEKYEATPRVYGMATTPPHETRIRGEAALLSPEGSLVQADCPSHGDDEVLLINVQYHDSWESLQEGEALIRSFTEEFIRSAMAEYGCTESS